ncbi:MULTISPECIES: hypothetical protein [unclassified Caballeronia]|uniref:hypothetical protein n=1 Tax=unclassified Caballeronia TaxID=2646786 RepID=UPI001F229339|nr:MULTISPECIES: hypothetical protein [unclassified Caballeronia]MCE4541384.1 hypothetical protein [Caballeronia sp. PC1]MCE4569572.1 hypothetical protein [Caballeronia sp. CLC5]
MTHKHHNGGNAHAVVSVRMTPETHHAMRLLAAHSDKTVSRILREYAEQITGRSGRPSFRDYSPHGG